MRSRRRRWRVWGRESGCRRLKGVWGGLHDCAQRAAHLGEQASVLRLLGLLPPRVAEHAVQNDQDD